MLHQQAWDRLFELNQLSRTDSLPRFIPVVWQVPGWPWVDPDKDSKAAERDIKNGLNSRHKVCMERGSDYEEIIQDLQREADDGFPIGGEDTPAQQEEIQNDNED
jgi:capsid protein